MSLIHITGQMIQIIHIRFLLHNLISHLSLMFFLRAAVRRWMDITGDVNSFTMSWHRQTSSDCEASRTRGYFLLFLSTEERKSLVGER